MQLASADIELPSWKDQVEETFGKLLVLWQDCRMRLRDQLSIFQVASFGEQGSA